MEKNYLKPMRIIKNEEFGGERPLFASHNLRLEGVTIHAGESALKCCTNIEVDSCRFEGKYPLWHVDGFKVNRCIFTPGARAALWYSSRLVMTDTIVEAPKMFREMRDLQLTNVHIPDAQETLWHCHGAKLRNVDVEHADYLFMHSSDIDVSDYRHQGNYAFQYCRNVVIRDAVIDAKDAFWNTEDVTLINCKLTGEYLGWHSHHLHLVDCSISGTQPLCYCHDLEMDNCTMAPDCDLAFEESTLQADIRSKVTSVKNPTSGHIIADGYGDIILDENVRQPADCVIEVR